MHEELMDGESLTKVSSFGILRTVNPSSRRVPQTFVLLTYHTFGLTARSVFELCGPEISENDQGNGCQGLWNQGTKDKGLGNTTDDCTRKPMILTLIRLESVLAPLSLGSLASSL